MLATASHKGLFSEEIDIPDMLKSIHYVGINTGKHI